MTIHVDPVRRNLKFHLPVNKVTRWNNNDLHLTQFFNTLSVFFPVGERFFIHSLRNYREQITDERLKAQISAFIGQEAFHGREHEEYNHALTAAGIPADRMEALVTDLLEQVKRLPKPLQLAATLSLEHLTALLGDILLREPKLLEGAEPHFKALWQWHALEETEHKAVAFDAYRHVMGDGPRAYAIRIFAFLLANTIFWSLFYPFYVRSLAASGGLWNLRGWVSILNYQFGWPGALRRLVPGWLDFFRPDFHPWMHDNRALLSRLDELAQEAAKFAPAAQSA